MTDGFDEALKEAIALKSAVEATGIEVANTRLEAELIEISTQFDLNAFVPGDDNTMGMAAKKGDAKAFVPLFKKRIRANLCDPNGEFTKLIQTGLHTSVGAVLTALVTALALPAAVLSLLIPIAVIVSYSGLEAFCEMGA